MALKRQAVPLPDLSGKRVLDIGCDMAGWSFHCASLGAASVLGLDRNREVRGKGFQNLIAQNEALARATPGLHACTFRRIDLGAEWHSFGTFDVVLMLSVYHHVYNNCGDHRAIWFWLWRHCAPGGEVLWEGPVDDSDPVVRMNVSDDLRSGYTRGAILDAARMYFDAERVGPALHEPTREVWRFRRSERAPRYTQAVMRAGAGGAAAAFEYEAGRRIHEIAGVLGIKPMAGSLNLQLDGPFDWDDGYVRARILDVKDRAAGLDSEWVPRWARFYPLTIDGVPAQAFRFEGERYDYRFMELIAPVRLRDAVKGPRVTLCR